MPKSPAPWVICRPSRYAACPADARSDLFSVGIVLHEMTTGQRPSHGGQTVVSDLVFRNSHSSAGQAPARLKAMTGDLVEENPEKRCGIAAEVHQELEALRKSLTLARRGRGRGMSGSLSEAWPCWLYFWSAGFGATPRGKGGYSNSNAGDCEAHRGGGVCQGLRSRARGPKCPKYTAARPHARKILEAGDGRGQYY